MPSNDELARAVAEINRRVLNQIRIAKVIRVDHARQRLKVQDGAWTSKWMRWMERRAHSEASWSPPKIGERVTVYSPCGDLDQAFAGPSLPCDEFPPPDNKPERSVHRFSDGTMFRQDSAAKVSLLQLPDDGELRIQIGSTTLSVKSGGIDIQTPSIKANGKPMATVGHKVGVSKGSSAGNWPIKEGVGS